MPILECTVAALVVLLAMCLAIRLVRFAANLFVLAIFAGATGFAIFNVARGTWFDWPTIVVYSLATGVAAAILCLPVLPFSRFNRKD